jgi:hypothetical protein
VTCDAGIVLRFSVHVAGLDSAFGASVLPAVDTAATAGSALIEEGDTAAILGLSGELASLLGFGGSEGAAVTASGALVGFEAAGSVETVGGGN